MAAANFRLLTLFLLLGACAAHSGMTEPQNTAPRECTRDRAGKSSGLLRTCAGPCDPSASFFLKRTSPQKPAAIYKRGETVSIKYSRNNHAPGGFVRLTLVPLDKMMDKKTHEKNAFHYSCWGARTVPATPADLKRDRFGFNIAGGDGKLHSLGAGYHVVDITIPPVVPDGDYVLGWVWFGGVGGALKNPLTNTFKFGFFGDYWSCSFVRVVGGQPLQNSYTPVFINDMKHNSLRGCYAANDDPGICKFEPCTKSRARYQVPKPFKRGRPAKLNPGNFETPRCSRPKVQGFCGSLPTSNR